MNHIKKYLLSLATFAVAMASYALEDNYLVGTTWGGAGAPSHWSLNHSSTIDNDIYIDYNYYYNNPIDNIKPTSSSWYISYWLPSTNSFSNSNSITIRNLFDPVTGESKTFTISNAASSDVYMKVTQNFTILSSNEKTSNIIIGKSGLANKLFSIKVGGDFIVGSADMGANDVINLKMGESGSNNVDYQGGIRNFNIDGNMKLYGATTMRTNIGTNAGSLANFDMKVAGVVSMISASGVSPTWFLNARSNNDEKLNTFIDIGGLQGDGIVRNDTKTLGGTTTLVFRTAAGVVTDFEGTLQDDEIVGQNSTISLLMAGYGTQILRNVNISGSSEVKRGTLFASGQMGKLLLGGKLGAISQNSDVGELYLTGLTIYDGSTLAVDINGTASDLIRVDGSLAGNGIMGIELGNLSNVEVDRVYEIINFNSTLLSSENFKLLDLPDLYEAYLTFSDNSLYITFTSVPEPAYFAIVLGGVALMLIVRRKRQ